MEVKGRCIKMSLCNIHLKRNTKKTLPRHIYANKIISEEASLYAFQKGSYTVEAAIVIPLVAGFLVSILFFFRVLQVQAAIDEALIYAGRKVAAESSITDSEAALFLSTEFFFLQILEEYECVEEYVDYGKLGISLLKSDFSEDSIYLRAEYSMKMPVAFFEIGKIYLWQQNTFRKWTGDGSWQEEDMVYVTSTGEVYHSSMNCQSIKLSVKYTDYSKIEGLKGANGQKYYACSRCADKSLGAGRVYFTDYGTLYHADISCSAIKRTVTQIPLSEIGERRKCSFCYTDKEE